MAPRLTAGLAALALAASPLLAGCGSDDSPSASPTTGGTAASTSVSVVASTDVWGDVVKQVAGSLAGSTVTISSIITDPDADPHTYEANTQNQLALSRAALVIENGGGYDDFMDSMLKTAGAKATVLNAVDISGHTAPAGGELNEHVWYDFPTVAKVADQAADALAATDPANASTYHDNAEAFDGKLQALATTETQIKTAHAGEGAAITEPVPLYLLEAAGLVNKTPADFSAAIEEDTDVSTSVLKKTLDLFSGHQVKVLAYNEQTSGPETEKVLAAAKAADIAVVPVTETLPEGKDYLTWMSDNLAAIAAALGS